MPVKQFNNKKITPKKKIGHKNTDTAKKIGVEIVKKFAKKKKMTRKTDAKKKSANKKEIKEAVKKIPSLIIKEMGQRTPQKRTVGERQESKSKIVEIYQAPHNKKVWLWTAVTIFTAIILGLWALNISTFFHNVKIQKDPTEDIMLQGKNDFQTILQTLQDNEKKLEEITTESKIEEEASNKEKIKKALEKTLGTLLNTTTTTNTPNIN